MEQVARSVTLLMGPESIVIAIQSGPGAGERIAQHIACNIARYIALFVVELIQAERVLPKVHPYILQ